jgi:hypothetical protein
MTNKQNLMIQHFLRKNCHQEKKNVSFKNTIIASKTKRELNFTLLSPLQEQQTEITVTRKQNNGLA